MTFKTLFVAVLAGSSLVFAAPDAGQKSSVVTDAGSADAGTSKADAGASVASTDAGNGKVVFAAPPAAPADAGTSSKKKTPLVKKDSGT